MQAKLLEADAARREALKQLQDMRSAADGERAQYEQQVRRAREEGSARITALEEVVKKLSNRSDLHEVGLGGLDWEHRSGTVTSLARHVSC